MKDELQFDGRRSPVLGRKGMVATSQPLAVAAGLEILRKGGNAADAAVAAAAALNVTEPTSTGIGGDCFALYYDAQSQRITALNGSGRAPAALTLKRLRSEGYGPDSDHPELPPFHPYTITVPGACAGWCDLVGQHGRLKIAQVLQPAIQLAEEGFPVSPLTAYFWARGGERQLANALNGRELTLDGRTPRAGEIFHNHGLARTLREVARHGKEGFYYGKIARAIAAVVKEAGGCLTEADLAAHQSTWEEPIAATYRGYRLWECPPNGQGLTALLALNILEQAEVHKLPLLSVERLHLEIEALRLAFADTRWFVADPATNPAPLKGLLSKEYAALRALYIDRKRATLDQQRGTPVAASDTVYLTVVDGDGNACSFIGSNYMGFGTGIVPKGWGFTLQNRGHNFSLDPKHPNALAPNKRPYHTIIPAMITHAADDALYASFGVMGGFMQPQGHVQVMLGLVNDKLDPQAALDQPRFCITNGEAGGQVAIEAGIPFETTAQLAQMGHPVVPVSGQSRAVFGRGQVIVRDRENGVLWGGSDPRADGCAMGL
ncbi:MAG: gamma-glutamyltransferase family protein [Anaerolineales bacterium]|jgi:gamma-glutamyltranspeptidase/glutathione hydrolase